MLEDVQTKAQRWCEVGETRASQRPSPRHWDSAAPAAGYLCSHAQEDAEGLWDKAGKRLKTLRLLPCPVTGAVGPGACFVSWCLTGWSVHFISPNALQVGGFSACLCKCFPPHSPRFPLGYGPSTNPSSQVLRNCPPTHLTSLPLTSPKRQQLPSAQGSLSLPLQTGAQGHLLALSSVTYTL